MDSFYIFDYGKKFKDKRIEDISLIELDSYLNYMEDCQVSDGLYGKMAIAYSKVKKWLKMYESELEDELSVQSEMEGLALRGDDFYKD